MEKCIVCSMIYHKESQCHGMWFFEIFLSADTIRYKIDQGGKGVGYEFFAPTGDPLVLVPKSIEFKPKHQRAGGGGKFIMLAAVWDMAGAMLDAIGWPTASGNLQVLLVYYTGPSGACLKLGPTTRLPFRVATLSPHLGTRVGVGSLLVYASRGDK